MGRIKWTLDVHSHHCQLRNLPSITFKEIRFLAGGFLLNPFTCECNVHYMLSLHSVIEKKKRTKRVLQISVFLKKRFLGLLLYLEKIPSTPHPGNIWYHLLVPNPIKSKWVFISGNVLATESFILLPSVSFSADFCKDGRMVYST